MKNRNTTSRLSSGTMIFTLLLGMVVSLYAQGFGEEVLLGREEDGPECDPRDAE